MNDDAEALRAAKEAQGRNASALPKPGDEKVVPPARPSPEGKKPVDVEPPRFQGVKGEKPTQRIHDADARLLLAGAVLLLFFSVFGVEVYGCFVAHVSTTKIGTVPHQQIVEAYGYCHDLHDFKDLLEPFTTAIFTAIGAAVVFYFTDRR